MRCTNVSIENTVGSFNAFGPEDAVSVIAAKTGARAAFLLAWIYLYGKKIQASTDEGVNFIAGDSDANRVIIQKFENNQGRTVIRAYLRATANNQTAQLMHIIGGVSASFGAGTYVDAEFNSDGSFRAYTNPTAFDENSPPTGSEMLCQMVDEERAPRNIP